MSESSADLENKLMSILSNPEALSGIMKIAKGFGIGLNEPSAVIEEAKEHKHEELSNEALPVSLNFKKEENKAKNDLISEKGLGLLLALKPFLSNSKCEKIDTIVQLMRVALMADLFK